VKEEEKQGRFCVPHEIKKKITACCLEKKKHRMSKKKRGSFSLGLGTTSLKKKKARQAYILVLMG